MASTSQTLANMHYGTGAEPVKRVPVPIDSIRLVQNECMKLDDDIRWLIALISDTGMRLAEAAGLRISNLHLDEDMRLDDLCGFMVAP